MIIHLLGQLDLDGIEELPINNGRLLARQDFALECHLSNVEPVAEQVGERSARERDATDGFSCFQGADLFNVLFRMPARWPNGWIEQPI
jgi:hypothetical protein